MAPQDLALEAWEIFVTRVVRDPKLLFNPRYRDGAYGPRRHCFEPAARTIVIPAKRASLKRPRASRDPVIHGQ
jgi:hypothetical protein